MTNNTFSSSTSISNNITAPKFFRFNLLDDTIEGSELNFKKAGDPTSAQYAELMQFKAIQPSFKFAPTASTKKVEKKQSYKGLNFDLMMDYVEFKGNDVQKAEFAEYVNTDTAYPTIKSWFVENFKVGFTVEKAKREIAEHKLGARKAKVRTTVKAKVVKAAPAVVAMPSASNF